MTQYEHALELFAVSVFSIAIPMALNCHPLTEWVWLVTAVQVGATRVERAYAARARDSSAIDRDLPPAHPAGRHSWFL